MPELLPCPFCGGEAYLVTNTDSPAPPYQVHCEVCRSRGAKFCTRTEAEKAWNRREFHLAPTPALPEKSSAGSETAMDPFQMIGVTLERHQKAIDELKQLVDKLQLLVDPESTFTGPSSSVSDLTETSVIPEGSAIYVETGYTTPGMDGPCRTLYGPYNSIQEAVQASYLHPKYKNQPNGNFLLTHLNVVITLKPS